MRQTTSGGSRRRSPGSLEGRKEGRLEVEASYLRTTTAQEGRRLRVKRTSMGLLAGVDAVVFDCDGVLIDARKSYDATIRVVTERMVKELTGVRLSLSRVAPKLISMVRRTGGFNNDWDTTYALTLFSLVALDGRDGGGGGGGRGRGQVGRAIQGLTGITTRFGASPKERGRVAVDSFLREEFPSLDGSLDRSRELLGYPAATPPGGRLTTAFDEVYFGGPLFEKVHGLPAKNPKAKGLIEAERTLVTETTLESLAKRLGRGRLAMVTGRPYLGTEHSLGTRIMGFMNRGSSIFIGDADNDPVLRPEYERYRKPSPDALIRAKEKLSSRTILYVGDSAEDLMMVQAARRRGLEGYLFAGIYGTSPVKADQASFFEEGSADMILDDVNGVPSALSDPSRGEGVGR